MNIHDLREAQAKFESQVDDFVSSRKNIYSRRTAFVKHFSKRGIEKMTIDQYVSGLRNHTNELNFCYTLERELKPLGSIIGSAASKFGVYYGRRGKGSKVDYQFVKRFGSNHKEAFRNLKQSLLDLLDAGKVSDLAAIERNSISPMVKGKILATYFPNKYLSVLSPEHLIYFLTELDIDSDDLVSKDAVYMREALVQFKNQDEIMSDWELDLFMHFLYRAYPGGPVKESNLKRDPLRDYRPIKFSPNPKATFVQLAVTETNPKSGSRDKTISKKGKKDYEKEQRKLKRLGDRGEKVVLDAETARLLANGKNKLAMKVDRVSLKSDSYGYDILSFENDGTKKFIEVKATRRKVGISNFFLTENELNKAKELANYSVYIVFEVDTETPKIWDAGNPFFPVNKNVVIAPTNYRVSIATTKIK